jgi:hypothetical protein
MVTDDIVIMSLVRGKSYMSFFSAFDLCLAWHALFSSHVLAHPLSTLIGWHKRERYAETQRCTTPCM